MLVSVLIPTYKRLEQLKHAVGDVYAQTYKDWELVITDDEPTAGETWSWLQSLAENDKRVRVLQNKSGTHGQVFNVNNGLKVCKGDWVKVLYDDDRMLPECLMTMVNLARKLPNVAMIGCRAQKIRNGIYKGDETDYSHGVGDGIRSLDCLKAMLMFDRWNGRTPTHMLIRRSAINAGAFMPEDAMYTSPVDCVWFASILMHGDYAMLRDVLVCQCEGEVPSLTSGDRQNPYTLDKELLLAYHDIYEKAMAHGNMKVSWGTIKAEINGVRGLYHLSCGRVMKGFLMVLRMLFSIRGTLMTIRWLLQEMFPSHFAATKRYSIS